jgi:hypothetical protein
MVCFFDIRAIDPECLRPDFGYSSGKPCVFVVFNNITGWEPEAFKTKEPEMFKPKDQDFADMPPDVRRNSRPGIVYIECKGNTPVDRENIGEELEIMPTHGFSTQYFPYNGHPDFMPPFIALRFRKATIGIAIGVTCRLWTKNLNATTEPSAILPFNILIE